MKDAITLLAFDYGERHIGVAVGQTLTSTAAALQSVDVRASGPDWGTIAGLVGEWQPDALVVGLPLNMDGTEQPMTHAARRFGNRLKERFRLPVHTADERLTTREAVERLAARGKPGADNNPVAAQIILENWLAGNRAAP